MSKSTYGLRKAGLATLATTLVMGAGIAGAGSASALPGFSFDRVGGADRYETSADIADDFAATNPDVILANGSPGNYADALSANTLAGEKNVPILLTRADKTPQPVLDQLAEDAVKNITVVGGETVITPAQVSSLESKGYTVTRVAGSDRFATNAQVISKSGAAASNTGLIATGFNFPDALAAGPFSFVGHPLGLSSENNIEQSVIDALKAAGVTKVLIFGGTSAVGPAVEAKLAANGITTAQRFAGADRSDTSELAAEYAVKNLGFTDKHLGVASGYTLGYGADALAGGPLEGKEKSPMLITRDVNNPDDVLTYLTAHCGTLVDGHLYGGPAAISVAAEAAMEKAADCAPASATSRPELRSAAIVDTNTASETGTDGTTVRYVFDESVLASGASGPRAAMFHVYNAEGTQYSAADVVSASGSEVVVRFTGLNTDDLAKVLSLATVDFDAVTDAQGQSNPIGDAAIGTAGGSTTAQPAGITAAPDLASVGGFRAGSTAGTTAVDFTFDEPAFITGAGGFHLILTDGTDLTATGIQAAGDPAAGQGSNPSGGGAPGGNGTTTITVTFTNPDGPDEGTGSGGQFDPTITAASVARGTDEPDTVSDEQQNTTAGLDTGNGNELQAAPVSASGNSSEPDLVSVELRPGATATANDAALFTFDQNVTQPTTPAPGNFHLYYVNGATPANGTSAEVNPNNRTQVLVTFASATATNNAVGGNIDDGAVVASDAAGTALAGPIANEQDEEGVSNTATDSGVTPGRTDGPDLTGVSLAQRTTGAFNTVVGANGTYTFDEALTDSAAANTTPLGASATAKFKLYLANGKELTATTCYVGPAAGTADNNTVVCEFTGPAGNLAEAMGATLGTVDDQAVGDFETTPNLNPEGAESTTGGTGTPSA